MNNAGQLIPLVAVSMTFGIPLVAVICHFAYRGWKTWLDAGVKRDMVARGYTAQEIVAVLGAESQSEPNAWLPNVPPAKPIKPQEVAS